MFAGMLFAMMGINPVSLKPMIKPFITGMGTEVVPFVCIQSGRTGENGRGGRGGGERERR